jgi:hypothetical protein
MAFRVPLRNYKKIKLKTNKINNFFTTGNKLEIKKIKIKLKIIMIEGLN